MTESDQAAGIAAARAYEDLHVPAMFGPWTGPLLDAVALGPGDRFLDVACGSGIVARAAVARVGESGRVTGLDIDPGMLAVAAERAPGIEWVRGSAEALPFPGDSFDVVACQFGLMYFPDRVAALRETGRVLAPGGRLGIAVWDRVEHSAVYPVLVEGLERLAGSEAAEALRAPFVLGDADELGALFVGAAGFESVALETRSVTARYPSVRVLVEAELRGWLPTRGVTLRESQVRAILVEAERALAAHVVADGALEFETRAHLVTAVRG